MTKFSVIPGALDFVVKRGDRFSTVVDFDISLTGYTAEAEVYSTVDGSTVQSITVGLTLASEGKVQLQLNSTETGSLAAGTYKWKLRWDAGNSAYRTALEGYFEVLP